MSCDKESNNVYLLMVDVDYPACLQPLHSDLPFYLKKE